MDLQSIGRLIARAGNDDYAIRTWRAASAGSAEGLFRLASWLIVGQPLGRNLPSALPLLRRSAEKRHGEAALLEIALTANGSGRDADWTSALALLKSAAAWNVKARAQLSLLLQMDLDEAGRPRTCPEGTRLSSRPHVMMFRGMVTAAECEQLAHAAADLLRPAQVVDPSTERLILDPVRTADAAVIGPARENLVVAAVSRRLAAATTTDAKQGEPLAIMRYAAGQRYKRHFDTLPGTRNQRIATAIVYLNQGYSGGRTVFNHIGLEVEARAGDVLVFHNTLPDGRPDAASLHEGLPVLAGTKWIATRWIRAQALDPWDKSTW